MLPETSYQGELAKNLTPLYMNNEKHQFVLKAMEVLKVPE